MTTIASTLIYLLRLAIGKDQLGSFPIDTDWTTILNISCKHGVSAIALDGLQKTGEVVPEITKFEWLGQMLQQEGEYESYRNVIRDLARFYDGHGIKMLLLKGYGLSLNYPEPSHRSVGDIDVYLFKNWVLADRMVERQLGIKVDRSHHHHTVFNYKGYLVENHYDCVDTKAHKEDEFTEKKLKDLALDSVEHDMDGVSVLLPSANFNAIFLVRHAGQHFAGERMTLRQLLDWALFIDKHSSEVDWAFVEPIIKKIGCWKFFCAINGICVDALGISEECFPEFDRDSKLEERLLNDILQPEFSVSGSGTLFKLRRWCANIWKHRIVYSEPLVPMFVRLAWSHVVKPKL